MEFVRVVKEEMMLRDQGKRGKLSNLSTLEVIALAYKLNLIGGIKK